MCKSHSRLWVGIMCNMLCATGCKGTAHTVIGTELKVHLVLFLWLEPAEMSFSELLIREGIYFCS